MIISLNCLFLSVISNCEHIELTFKAAENLHNSSDFCQWSGPSLETSDVTLVWDGGKQVKAQKDKLCRGSAWRGPSLETSDVSLVWDGGKDKERNPVHSNF